METIKRLKVGDIVVPADGSKYRGEVLYISKEEDVVRHKCLTTGKVYEKSWFGFFCRYMTEEEFEASKNEDMSDLCPPKA